MEDDIKDIVAKETGISIEEVKEVSFRFALHPYISLQDVTIKGGESKGQENERQRKIDNIKVRISISSLFSDSLKVSELSLSGGEIEISDLMRYAMKDVMPITLHDYTLSIDGRVLHNLKAKVRPSHPGSLNIEAGFVFEDLSYKLFWNIKNTDERKYEASLSLESPIIDIQIGGMLDNFSLSNLNHLSPNFAGKIIGSIKSGENVYKVEGPLYYKDGAFSVTQGRIQSERISGGKFAFHSSKMNDDSSSLDIMINTVNSDKALELDNECIIDVLLNMQKIFEKHPMVIRAKVGKIKSPNIDVRDIKLYVDVKDKLNVKEFSFISQDGYQGMISGHLSYNNVRPVFEGDILLNLDSADLKLFSSYKSVQIASKILLFPHDTIFESISLRGNNDITEGYIYLKQSDNQSGIASIVFDIKSMTFKNPNAVYHVLSNASKNKFLSGRLINYFFKPNTIFDIKIQKLILGEEVIHNFSLKSEVEGSDLMISKLEFDSKALSLKSSGKFLHNENIANADLKIKNLDSNKLASINWSGLNFIKPNLIFEMFKSNIDIMFDAQNIKYGDYIIPRWKFKIYTNDDNILLSDLIIDIFGGSLEGKGQAILRDNKPEYYFSFSTKNTQIEQALKTLYDVKNFTGYFNSSGIINSKGSDFAEFQKNFNGQFKVSGKNFTMANYNLKNIAKLPEAQMSTEQKLKSLKYYTKYGNSDFSTIKGDINVKDGIVYTNNIRLSGKRSNASYSGSLDITTKRFKSILKISLIPYNLKKAVRILLKSGGMLPNPIITQVDNSEVQALIDHHGTKEAKS